MSKEVIKIVENQSDKGSTNNINCSELSSSKCGGRLLCQTVPTQLVLKHPLWFRLLLKVPQLPSIVWMPDLMGLLCYCILPAIIILGYIVIFVYSVLILQSPLVYLLLVAMISPLWLISMSAKAHAFLEHWQLLTEKRFVSNPDTLLQEYVELVKKKEE